MALPGDDFAVSDRVVVAVGKQPYIRFDTNDYSVPERCVRKTLVVLATATTVRVLDEGEEVATHKRSFGHREQIENPAHHAEMMRRKAEARKARGLDRLHAQVPSSGKLLQEAARRGHNLGSAVAGLLRLVDTWGAEAVQSAVEAAIAVDAMHVAAVRQVLEQRAQEAGTPPPVPVALPDDPRVQDVHVTDHQLASYDPEVSHG